MSFRTHRDILVLNPDGVTDVSADFQAAIDLLPSTGGEIMLPSGNFLLSSTVTINANADKGIRLVGQGVSTNLIVASGGTGITVTGDADSWFDQTGIYIGQMRISGATFATRGSIGIQTDGFLLSTIEQCEFENLETGIFSQEATGQSLGSSRNYRTQILNNHFITVWRPIHLNGAHDPIVIGNQSEIRDDISVQAGIVSGPKFDKSEFTGDAIGIFLEECWNGIVSNNSIETHQQDDTTDAPAIRVDTHHGNLQISNIYTEGSDMGLKIDGGGNHAAAITITNCDWLAGTAGYGIYLAPDTATYDLKLMISNCHCFGMIGEDASTMDVLEMLVSNVNFQSGITMEMAAASGLVMFENCRMTGVTRMDNLTIGELAFRGCRLDTGIAIDDSPISYLNIDGCHFAATGAINVDNAGAQTIDDVSIKGCYFANPSTSGCFDSDSNTTVTRMVFVDNISPTSTKTPTSGAGTVPTVAATGLGNFPNDSTNTHNIITA